MHKPQTPFVGIAAQTPEISGALAALGVIIALVKVHEKTVAQSVAFWIHK